MKNVFIQKMFMLWKEFIPLSLSDVTMALGDPMVNGALAQLPRIQTNLGALGIVKAIAVLFESPIIMMLHASNTLSAKKEARAALGRLLLIVCIFLTVLLAILAIPFCFFAIMENLIGIPKDIAQNAHKMLLCLLLWPASIAIRRYFQGILILHGQRNTIAHAGFLRLFTLFLCLVIGYYFHVEGYLLAGASLMIAIASETIAVVYAAKKYKNLFIENNHTNDKMIDLHTVKDVWRFYWPLAHSMLLVWGGRALLIACLAQAVDNRVALAIWPLAWSLVILFANATRMVQQVIIRNQAAFHPLDFIFFALSVGSSLCAVLIFISTSNIGQKLLMLFAGQDTTLLSATKNVLLISCSIPILVSIQNVLQGFLISSGHTKEINRATLYGTLSLLVCAFLGIHMNFRGAQVAAYSMLIALVIEVVFLTNQISWKNSIHKYLQQQNIQEG